MTTKQHSTPNPLDPITDDPHDPVLTDLRIANLIRQALFGPLLNERPVPTPVPGSRCLTLVKGASK